MSEIVSPYRKRKGDKGEKTKKGRGVGEQRRRKNRSFKENSRGIGGNAGRPAGVNRSSWRIGGETTGVWLAMEVRMRRKEEREKKLEKEKGKGKEKEKESESDVDMDKSNKEKDRDGEKDGEDEEEEENENEDKMDDGYEGVVSSTP